MESHHSRRQLEDIFFVATAMALGINPDPLCKESAKRIRFSWPDSTNSDWKHNDDVVFLRISPRSDPYGEQQDITYDEGEGGTLKEVVRYHRCHSIDWVCYGPNSDQDADAIRIGILSTPVHDYLMRNSIAILPEIGDPIRFPEQDAGGEWWQRYDLHADMYEGARREYEISRITEPPDITIFTEQEG